MRAVWVQLDSGLSARVRPICLPQRVWETLGEAGHLISKAGASFEVQMPPVARIAPVADIGDPPVRRCFHVNDEIDATTFWAVGLASTEDHLAALRIDTNLTRREPERDQYRIEGRRHEVESRLP